MKKIIMIVAVFYVGLSAFAYDIAANTPVKGAVRTVARTDFSVTAKFGEYFRTPSAKFLYKYDSYGRRTEASELTVRDALINKVVNVYDAAGNLTEQTGFDEDNAKVWRSVITYKDGMKSDISEFGKDNSLKSRTIYSYSGKNLSDETSYNGDGAIIWKTVYTYNDRGQLAEENEYTGDGALNERRVYVYTDAGLNDTISYFDGNGMLRAKDVFRYGTGNVLSEVTTYGADNRLDTRTIVKFDNAGNLAKITTYTVSKKFGTVMNEMTGMTEFVYNSVSDAK